MCLFSRFRKVAWIFVVLALLPFVGARPAEAAVAIAFRSQTSATTSNTQQFTIDINKPAGLQSGDLLVAAIASGHYTNTATLAGPAGWSRLDGQHSQYLDTAIFYKIATGAESATYTFTSDVQERMVGIISAYSGVNTATPFLDFGSNLPPSGTVRTTPSAAVIGTGAWLLSVFSQDLGASWTPPAGDTQRASTVNTGFNNMILADTNGTVSSGNYTKSATANVSSTDSSSFLLVLNPGSADIAASMTLADPRATQTTTYELDVSAVTLTPIQCMRLEFDTMYNGSGSIPAGMNISSAALNATSNYVPSPGSWSTNATQATGVITFTNASGGSPPSSSGRSVVVTGITSPTSSGIYYALFSTYTATDCSTGPVNRASVAFTVTDGTAVAIDIRPVMTFSVAGLNAGSCNAAPITATGSTASVINLGHVGAGNVATGAQTFNVTTNAASGYSVFVRSLVAAPALREVGGQSIADVGGSNALPGAAPVVGVPGFGYTVDDSTLSGNATRFTASGPKYAALTTSNQEVAYSASGYVSETQCIAYSVTAGPNKPASYSTTVVYTMVPTY